MSRRPQALTLVAILCLVLLGLGAPLLARPAKAFGERVFQANPIVGPGDPYYDVNRNATLAQSFTVTRDYTLLNATLRVKNDGGTVNALAVSIHPDDPMRHVPLMSSQLASTSQVSPNNQPAPVNWSFPFNPSPFLRAGNVYWIVAENTAPQPPPTNGYEWHESNRTYTGGSAWVLDTRSGLWTGLPYDLYFVTYGREWAANVTLAMTVSPTRVQPGDSVSLTVDVNNTGTQAAPWVWVNSTIPAQLANVSVVFPGLQPVSAAAFPNLTFQNVGNGAHSFTVRGQIQIPTPPGTVVVNRASLEFQNTTGVTFRGAHSNASLVVGLATKQLYLDSTAVTAKLLTTVAPTSGVPASSTLTPGAAQPLQFLLDSPLARPFASAQTTVSLWASTQKSPPQTYRLNVTLLENGTPVKTLNPTLVLTSTGYQPVSLSFGAFAHMFPATSRIGLSISSLGGGGGSTDNLLLRYNGTSYPSRIDLVTTTYVSIDNLAITDPQSNSTVWSPLDPIVVRANLSDPFGNGKIRGAWINITSPAGTRVATGAMRVLATDPSTIPAWILFNYTLSPPLATGEYRIDIAATEDNGVVALGRGYADVAAPLFAFADAASVGRALAGGSFAFYLYYNNSGTGSAGTVWLNETLPTELAYVMSTLPPTTVAGNVYGWVVHGVPVGNHRLEIDVRVLASSAIPAWIQDRATLDYTDGSGHLESPLSASAAVFLNGPVLTLSVSSSPLAGIHSNETVAFTIGLPNSGADSGRVWLNDTLPAGLNYVSDTAAALGATMTQVGSQLQYVIPQLSAGSNLSFAITALAGPALIRNASYVNSVDLSYTSTNGYLMPPETASTPLVALSPAFSDAEVRFLAPESPPGGTTTALIHLLNDGNEPASVAWVNLSVDTRLGVRNASSPYTTAPGTVDFALMGVRVGVTTVYLNLTVSVNAVDGSNLQMNGSLDARDGYGNPLPRFAILRTSELVTAASFSLAVSPTQPDIEAGVAVPLTVTMDNSGSGNASNAWLNLSIPGTLEFVNDTSGATPSVVGSLYAYHWTVPSPVLVTLATTVFILNVRARAATPNGTAADIGFQLSYQDANLLSRGGVNQTVHARIVAPSVVLRVEASAPSLFSGGTFNYTLHVSNQGQTIAGAVVVVDNVDPRLLVESFTSSVPGQGTQNLSWIYTDLAPGESETINLTVRTIDGLAVGTDLPNSIEATYTNSEGTVLASIRSLPVTVHIGQDYTPFLWILGVAGIFGGAVAVFLSRRQHVEIEEAFLVYRDGVLLSHLSRTLLREKDEDVLSGMLTAVQEFVREAFQYGEHRDLHQLDFGDYRILIERGKYVYLAVVYSGAESPAIRKKVRTVIALIEHEFGAVLSKWDGDMEQVVGARDLIRDTLLGSNNHTHAEHALPQHE